MISIWIQILLCGHKKVRIPGLSVEIDDFTDIQLNHAHTSLQDPLHFAILTILQTHSKTYPPLACLLQNKTEHTQIYSDYVGINMGSYQ